MNLPYLPIENHLIALLQEMYAVDIQLIIAGGLGIYLKRRWVVKEREAGRRNVLFDHIPDARATDDIDAFLELEVLGQPKRSDFCSVLEDLGYESIKKYLQWRRQGDSQGPNVILDLLAPPPIEDPTIKVAWGSKPPRMGVRNQKSDPPLLHAYPTPEAFAVEDSVQTLPLLGRTLAGDEFKEEVRVPHPFASLCMKIRAAADYASDRRPRGEKHAQDVYLLVAMLSEDEVDDFDSMCERYAEHPEFVKVCKARAQLFGGSDAPGCVTIRQHLRDADLERFASVTGELFPAV